jgi:hypothetical protein
MPEVKPRRQRVAGMEFFRYIFYVSVTQRSTEDKQRTTEKIHSAI